MIDGPHEREGAAFTDIRPGLRPQYTLRQMFLLTTLVAVVLSLGTWLGWSFVALAAAAWGGALVALAICPWLGLDYVLDNIKLDVLRCLAVGLYVAAAGWLTAVSAAWLIFTLFERGGLWMMIMPLMPIIFLGLFLVGLALLVRWLWPLAEKAEITVIMTVTFLAAIAALACAPPHIRGVPESIAWLLKNL